MWRLVEFTADKRLSQKGINQVSSVVRALPTAMFLIGWDTIIVAVILVVWVGTVAYADDQIVKMWNAPDMIGKPVKDQEGNALGRVQDLVLQWRSDGYIEYVVLSQGGMFGLGEERIAVPWEALTPRKDHFVLDMQKVRLAALPEFVRYRFYDRSLSAVLGTGRPPTASSAHVVKGTIESAAHVSGLLKRFEIQNAMEQEFSR
jgi:sporulation protein YlmC with PRC-barrel domain